MFLQDVKAGKVETPSLTYNAPLAYYNQYYHPYAYNHFYNNYYSAPFYQTASPYYYNNFYHYPQYHDPYIYPTVQVKPAEQEA